MELIELSSVNKVSLVESLFNCDLSILASVKGLTAEVEGIEKIVF